MAAILGIGAEKPKGLNNRQAKAWAGRKIVAPQRLVIVWRCGCVGTPMLGKILWGGVRIECGGCVCAVLCQCLHDAMGGHKMDMVGDTCRGGGRRGRECCAKARGFGTPSRQRQCGFYFIIIYVDFAFVE